MTRPPRSLLRRVAALARFEDRNRPTGPPVPEGHALIAWLDQVAELAHLHGTANPALMESIEKLRQAAMQRVGEIVNATELGPSRTAGRHGGKG